MPNKKSKLQYMQSPCGDSQRNHETPVGFFVPVSFKIWAEPGKKRDIK